MYLIYLFVIGYNLASAELFNDVKQLKTASQPML